MKIKDMNRESLLEALQYMVEDNTTKHYVNFNFDHEEWRAKLNQLLDAFLVIEMEED